MMGPLFKNARGRRQFPPIDACWFTLILLAIFTGSASAQTPPDQGCVASPETSQLLTSSAAPVDRQLKAKEKHVYHVTLSPEEYAHIVVNQKGIDVIVRLFDPNYSLLIQRDSPNSQFGPEKISTVAQVSGNYHVVVCGAENEPGGNYQIKFDGPRARLAADDRRLLAEQAYYQASKLQEQGNSNALEGAVSYYQESANLWREAGDVNEEGYAFSNVGDIYRSLRQFNESEANLETALTRLRQAGDISGQAYALNSLGATYRDLGKEPGKGIERYNEALNLRRIMGDKWGEAQLLNNLGRIHEVLGQREESLRNLEAAYTIWQALGARNQEMNTLNNIATTKLHTGNMTEAFDQFQTVLNFCKNADSPCRRLEPYVRNSLGVIYDTWGQPNNAIAEYNLALTLFPELKKEDTRSFQATALDNWGLLLIGLEDRNEALEKFQQALKLRVELKSPGHESFTRSNLGFLHILQNNFPDAFTELEKALALSDKTNARIEGNTLMRLGFAHFKRDNDSLNDPAKALDYYGRALAVQTRIGDVRGQAITLHYMAEFYSVLGQPVNARRYYRNAQEQWKEVRDLLGESVSLYGLAKLERQQTRLPEARDAIVESIKRVESVRTRMSNFYLRQIFFDARHDYYKLEADIRMQLYDALKKKKSTQAESEMRQALLAVERARSRNLLDVLNESQTDIREGVDPVLLKEEDTLSRQISEKLDQLQQLVHLPDKQTEKIKVQQELDALNRRFDHTRGQIRNRSKHYAALTQPQPLKPAQIQGLLDDETCLLQYMIGEERSYLWFVTHNDIRPYTLPGRKVIQGAVDALRAVIRVHEPMPPSPALLKARINAVVDYPKRVFELSNMVLKPVTSRMGFKRIIVVADGPLQYIPFGALTVPNEANEKAAAAGRNVTLLMANHEVIYEPSASVLAWIRRDPRRTAAKTVAVIADPVFSRRDERVQGGAKLDDSANVTSKEDTEYSRIFRDAGDVGSVGGSLRLARLRYSRQEAEAIVGVAGADSSLVALDFDASRTKVLSEDLRHFKYVHLATHGILDGVEPALSGLVFSLVDKQGRPAPGFLRLSDIYNLKLPVDLVVLSACESALGEEVKSEGLTGLTRGFMYAGAAGVVASLWKVDDEATAELMKRFYTYMIEKKMPPSKALRQAQLEMPTVREMWQPSFYWAGFVLQGEWK